MNKIFGQISQSVYLLLASACLFFASTLKAEPGPYEWHGWMGAAWLHDNIKGYDVEYDHGFACGIALDCSCSSYLKTECELLYLYNSIREIKVRSFKTGLRGGIATYSLLGNIILQYPIDLNRIQIVPYLGSGIGTSVEWTHVKAHGLLVQKDRERGFAYQFLGGISTPSFSLASWKTAFNLEARYLHFDRHIGAFMAIAGLSIGF